MAPPRYTSRRFKKNETRGAEQTGDKTNRNKHREQAKLRNKHTHSEAPTQAFGAFGGKFVIRPPWL